MLSLVRPLTRSLVATLTATTVGGALALSAAGAATAAPVASTTPGAVAIDAAHHRADVDPVRAIAPGLYVVTLTRRPAAAYAGGLPGLPATRAESGARFDRTRPAVRAYRERLLAEQDDVLAGIGHPQVAYRYTTALNGFAAELTTDQVKQLRGTPGVALVERSTTRRLDSVDSPGFLGTAQAWAANGGPDDAGRDTVIGVIDSGIWPENPSFAALPNSSRTLPGFHGACQTGEQWNADDCNDKVIAARYFVKGFGQGHLAKAEYLSPRDGSGHGSHTASTAAGNHAVSVDIEGQDFGFSSGMAPAARIAAYKACWTAPNPEDDGCATADTVAAIDQAVADGVDVLSYSVAGSRNAVTDSVELAFLNATASGVFVATSAGNTGPGAGTVSHASPWVATVGASTHHLYQGSVVLGDDAASSFVGAMVSDQDVPSSRLVLSADVPAPGATTQEAQICEIGSLDAAEVQDSIVVCDRGTTARVDKSVAVARAGGAGMILANVRPDSVDADFHSVPTVHVDVAAADAIKDYVRAAGNQATAAIDASGSDATAVPQIAEFSARGPSAASDGDILKPDLTAPGVSVVSAVAPPSNSGRLWDLYSGTSMSTPHVAGLAAFVLSRRPGWSPAQVKSAMMTTANRLEGTAGPFAQGAGNIDPTEVLDPGLVFDADAGDYRAFLAGEGFVNADGTAVSDRRIDANQLNLPSIAVGSLAGSTTVSRRVTNLSGRSESFAPTVSGLDGLDVTVRPRQLTLSSGESARFTVRFESTPAAVPGTFSKGALTWTGLQHQVRIPVVVRPLLVDAPTEVVADGESGSVRVEGVSGAGGEVALQREGLVSAMPTGVTLVPGDFDAQAPIDDEDTFAVPVQVDEGADLARFQMDAHNAGDDLDLFVYRDGEQPELVAQSASDSADETVTLVEPEAGDYTVYVHAQSAANGSTATGQFYSWVVAPNDVGNLDAPDAVLTGAGDPFSYELTWDDLGTSKWFGAVRYGDSEHRTLVTIG